MILHIPWLELRDRVVEWNIPENHENEHDHSCSDKIEILKQRLGDDDR